MYIVLATNSNLETVGFGPYKTEKKAEQNRKRVSRNFPNIQTLVLKLHDITELKDEPDPGS
jgi:hypothetical protein